ncbi:hypothetical protein RJT34_21584 [Clitoria ternatea]|uniref:Uncharacterized protein n=1 Tax=Clitoria ternatea TaxID=43366 RepID=A0AAN9IUQ7_CLITE
MIWTEELLLKGAKSFVFYYLSFPEPTSHFPFPQFRLSITLLFTIRRKTEKKKGPFLCFLIITFSTSRLLYLHRNKPLIFFRIFLINVVKSSFVNCDSLVIIILLFVFFFFLTYIPSPLSGYLGEFVGE